jgi:3'-5' exonuclease
MQEEQYLVFDIETVPLPWESFSESQQEYILRRAETEEDKAQKLTEMALAPLTAQIVCIGLQLMQSTSDGSWEMLKRAAFSVDNSITDGSANPLVLSGGDSCYLSSESKVIEDFWKILRKYDRASLISFNGRNFDCPFLMLRSAIKKIRPTRNLMEGTKFNYKMHIDLLDELTFYSGSTYGATRRFNFDFYTRAFGITSPKSEGIDGSKVSEFFAEGKILEISEYCLRDVKATWDLFLEWRKYLR